MDNIQRAEDLDSVPRAPPLTPIMREAIREQRRETVAVQHIQAATTRSRQELARGDIIPDNVQSPPEPVDDAPRQFLTVPTEKELWSQLLPEGVKIHLTSRPLGGLDPVSKWPPRMNIEWKKQKI